MPLFSSRRQLLNTYSAWYQEFLTSNYLVTFFSPSAQEGPHMLMSHLAGVRAGHSMGSHCYTHGQMAPTALLPLSDRRFSLTKEPQAHVWVPTLALTVLIVSLCRSGLHSCQLPQFTGSSLVSSSCSQYWKQNLSWGS